MSEATRSSGRGVGTLLAYLLLVLVWGASFLFMKVALEEFTPVQVALGRLGLGALTLVAVMLLSRRRWPREPWLWGHLSVVAVFLCVLPFLLYAWAGQFLPSGLSSILNATTPLWTALFTGLAVRSQRLRAGQVLGIAVGAVGVGIVMGVWEVVADPAFGASLPAQLACLGATASYGIGFAWMRRFVTGRTTHDAPTLAAVQVTTGAVIGLVVAGWSGGPIGQLSLWPVLSLLLLGALGTGIAYIWNTRVVLGWGTVAASTVTYAMPVVGVGLGVLILGERFEWYQPLGALVIVLGILLVQRVLGRRR